MVDLRVLNARGYSPERLRGMFLPEGGPAQRDPRIKQLLDLTLSRVREGVNRNLRHARHYWTIDQACDVSERTMSATALRGIRSMNVDFSQAKKLMTEFGLSSLISPMVGKDGRVTTDARGNILYKIDDAPLVEIIAPICQQYLNARWATIVTSHESSPWMKYSPLVYSRKNHLKTAIFTSRAEQMVHEMGYRSDFRQEVLGALKYGFQFVFSMEPFYTEKQEFMDGSADGDGIVERVVRSGIRNTMPHPSRTFWDLSHRLSTINTNTGMQYAGYWDIYRWGDVRRNKNFWLPPESVESQRFGYGFQFEHSAWSMFNQLYPCSMSLPNDVWSNSTRSDKDRSSEAFRVVYNSDDQGVVISPIFQKLIPSEWGLFEYDHPVWFCFWIANADTPILVEPYAYTPVRVAQYQGDQNHWRPPSMVTDLVPFQDSIGNLLSHYLMTVRRNLVNLIYYNKDSVSKEVIDSLTSQQVGLYSGFNFVPVSFSQASIDSTTANISDQFKSVAFTPANAVEVISAINTMLGIVERVIGFTAQEVGTTGAHVQTAEEIRVMTDFANNRIALTDAFIDSSRAAQKVQVYEAVMNYDDDLIMASISDLTQIDRQELESMGILIEEGPDRRVGVLADKAAMQLASFSADREGSRRTNDAQIATALMQFAQTLFSVPDVVQGMGIGRIIDVFNTIGQFAGLPPEARIPIPDETAPVAQQQQQMMEGIRQMVVQMMGQEFENVGQGIREQVVAPLEQAIQQLSQRVATAEQVVQQIVQSMGPAV